jgi:tetratricopeptide (TPR) repeat protein
VTECARIAELRRRVEADPASTAFAQLAEELRRSGAYHEAVQYCRAGLARHPRYLAGRVTLGRSLLELGALDEAARELDLVLQTAPDHLPAIRALAEIHQRQGRIELALEYYKRALALARFDADLEEVVTRLDTHLTPSAARAPVDFDKVLTALGSPAAEPPPAVDALISGDRRSGATAAFHLDDSGTVDPNDPFVRLEQELRAHRPAPTPEQRALRELEGWLSALADARQRSTAT